MWKKALQVGPQSIPPAWRYNFTPDEGFLIYWYNYKQTGPDRILSFGVFVTIMIIRDPNDMRNDIKIFNASHNEVIDNTIGGNEITVPSLSWNEIPFTVLKELFVRGLVKRDDINYEAWKKIRKATPIALKYLIRETESETGRLSANRIRIARAEMQEAIKDDEPEPKMALLDDLIEVPSTTSGQISATTPISSYISSGTIGIGRLSSGAITGPIVSNLIPELSSPIIDRIKSEEEQQRIANTRPTPPEKPEIGNIWTDTSTGKIRIWTGTNWIEITPITNEQAQAKIPDWLVPPKPQLPLIGRKILDETT